MTTIVRVASSLRTISIGGFRRGTHGQRLRVGKAEKRPRVPGGNLAQLRWCEIPDLGNLCGRESDPSWLIHLTAERMGGQIRAVGLDQDPIEGHLASDITQSV